MNGIVDFYRSSVGRKVAMSLTGLFLCIFLLEHLVGNLLLLKDDGGVTFDAFSEFMTSNPVIRLIEIVLFASILIHAWSGIMVWLKNKRSRPKNYEVYGLAENTKFASRWMASTAFLIFVFLVIHLKTFFVKIRLGEHVSGYHLAHQVFADPYYSWFYIISFLVLAYHLYHGFQSAFQTLGLKTKKYGSLIEAIAVLFWLVVPLGFAIIPLVIMYQPYSLALAK